MNEIAETLKERSIRFALRLTGFCRKLPDTWEESDEAVFWLTFVGRAGMSNGAEQKELLDEASQLLAIFMASAKTAGKKRAKAD